MISLQIISKIINTGDFSIIEDNQLDKDYFVGYEDEFNYIVSHHEQYGNVPDKATFLAKFPSIELVDVKEGNRYLVDTIREEYLYYKSVPIVQKIGELLKSDSNAATEYMLNAVKDLQPNYSMTSTDIIKQVDERYNEYLNRLEHQENWYFTTGFKELDELTHGLQRGEELFVLFARTNQGKSWILEKMCTHVWQLGFNVGYVSPEMSASSVGYRFDTLYKNFSNKALAWGKEDVADYKDYIDTLKTKDNKFIVATPFDFNRKITVSKLRNWVKQYKLDLIAIDGITYMTDERGKRLDNKTTTLTNISEDLMSLSVELGIPVLVVVQSNRSGVAEDNSKEGTPELESIRDSDGIAHNASKVISIRQLADNILEMGIKKNRFGANNGKLKYTWNIDTGNFTFIPSYDDAQTDEQTHQQVEQVRRKFNNDATDLF